MHPLIAQKLGFLQNPAGGEEGGAGGGQGEQGGGTPPAIHDTPEFKQALAEAVEQQTLGLKANRDSFQQQLSQAKEKLAKYGDADPDTVNALLQRFDTQEEQELLKAGKVDEIVNRRVDKMKSSFDAELSKRDQLVQQAQARQKSLENRAIAAEITKAATEAGALPSALTDFVQRSQGNFALNEEGNVIAVDKEGNQVYDVDGKTPLSAKSWAAGLLTDAPHLFGKPASGGTQGGNGQRTVGKVDGTQAEREAFFASKYNLQS